ncbi:RNA polymerase factor sigma-54 [Vagococcus sp. BWB3-3]|uniref:RNA polymerase factor sigma-54 n=1 Tax=Vagococcus allomyrinae TaxID=2794353 RepID=A0A940P9U0_9ENTE|nr:RNA polymerase factor sigma-54 [Vagococcus allomyrinae]MBP1044404.1 RNA polymerase factor sigma-54 [Vagococcus allomyrinae]
MQYNQNLSQQQKQVQKMAMTQQLQQSIQMLQYSTDDLLTFLESKALENPLIDVKIESDYADLPIRHTSKKNYEGPETSYLNQIPDRGMSLFESLLAQIHLNYRDTYLRQLIIFFTEYVDVNGYLTITLEEAVRQTGADYIQMLDALILLQQLDPAGVGARDLQECLLLQIERDNEAPPLAYVVIEEEFENFANRKWKEVANRYGVDLPTIQEIHDYIQSLSPFPGAAYGESTEQYINPDLLVNIKGETIEVLSTRSGAPVIEFQQRYFDKMAETGDREVKQYIKEKKAEFDWIKRSVTQRGDTILRVGTEIVSRQAAFFLDTERPLKPMTLKEIAEELEIHESTVSRAVNGKYLQTKFGVFELRSFFTTGLSQNSDGEEVSAADVQTRIKQLVEHENKAKPLSDQKIVDMLQSEGVEISRRTVAKYRDILGIAASSKRKRYD